jgi:SNF2 family DNA or RNA helicase
MLFETPEDTYTAYKRFLRKKEYKKAYRCLEKLHCMFPEDLELIANMAELCIFKWNKPDIGKKWLVKLARTRYHWLDYVLLSEIELELKNIEGARNYFKIAKKLQRKQPWLKGKIDPKKMFAEVESNIKHEERLQSWNKLNEVRKKEDSKANKFHQSKRNLTDRSNNKKGVQGKNPHTADTRKKLTTQAPKKKQDQSKTLNKEPENNSQTKDIQIPVFNIPVKIEPLNEEKLLPFLNNGISTLKDSQLLIDYTHLTIQSGFDELLCLNAITNVEKYWYQIETVKRVLKYFRGRVLLSDEVGLGKTIEAGMLIKEYLKRGMVKNILVLTPTPLVSQWKEEMQAKFDIEFVTTDNSKFMKDINNFWKQRLIIASINTAKSSKNLPIIAEQFYDLVVVDEAHHLRNRKTLAWKLVNQIKKKFIFLLTATPVQNNLLELFNLITLLKPGQFKTEKLFKQEYVQPGNLKSPSNKDKLRGLLRDVMIRNTRSAIDIKLPKRFASTIRIEPTETEKEIYTGINDYLKRNDFKKPMINLLLREAGSSPFALKKSLLKMDIGNGIKDILDATDSLKDICKGKALIDILLKNRDEKKVIFTQYIKSMDYITDLVSRHNMPYVMFRGNMSSKEKDTSIERFKNDVLILVSTESGGEGRNLQFCNTIINFDLPWNPMRIEQRIGRLHRIGQTRDVFIFNLSIKGTIEDYIIDILDNKINMFEMVIGEIEPILGNVEEDKDFEDIITDIWLKSSGTVELKDGFEQLSSDLVNAKNEYLKTKALDDEIFGEDYET